MARSDRYLKALGYTYRQLLNVPRELFHSQRVYRWMVRINRREEGLPDAIGDHEYYLDPSDPGTYRPPLPEDVSLAAFFHNIPKCIFTKRPSEYWDLDHRRDWTESRARLLKEFVRKPLTEAGYSNGEALHIEIMIMGERTRFSRESLLLCDADDLDFITHKVESPEWYAAMGTDEKISRIAERTERMGSAARGLLIEHRFSDPGLDEALREGALVAFPDRFDF